MERQESDDSPVFSILPPNLHRHLEDSSSATTASSTIWSSFGGSTAQNDQDHRETNDDENDHVGSFRLDESTTTTTTRRNHDESLAIVPFASTSTPAFVASSTNTSNTSTSNTNNDSSSSASSLERDRQLLLLALLEQVCSLHDATPRTFAAHALNLSERGVLDPAVVRVLFEYRGLAPPASPLSWPTTTTTTDGDDDDAGALVARETSSLRRHLESLVASRSDGSSSSSSSFSVEDLPLVASRWRREFVRLGRLASGSFGAVFRARRRGLGTRDGHDDGPDYAVKRVSFSAEGFDATAVRTALREVACLSRLDHPHVVRYYASWLEPRWTTSDDDSDDDDEVSDDDEEQQEFHNDDERGRAVRLLLTDAAETRHGKTSGDTKPTTGTTTSTTSKTQRPSLDKRVSSFDDDDNIDDDDGRMLRNSFESDDVSEWTRDDNDDDEDDVRRDETTTTDWNSERTDNGFRFESASRDDVADDGLDFDESLSRNHRSGDDDESRRRRERARASPRGRRPATFRYRVCLYVQMQLCRPTTLADWIRDRDRRPDQAPPEVRTRQALAVFRQIVDGLAHVHERSVVHRDLKPANVLPASSSSSTSSSRDKGYYVTGRLSTAVYRDDCLFTGPDPDMPVRGLRKYLAAASKLFDHRRSFADLLDLTVVENDDDDDDGGRRTIEARWRLGGVLMLPWHPVVEPYTGRTTYHVDEEGLIFHHEEHWDISVWQAFTKIILQSTRH